jgi:hypothetical protein
MPDFLIVKVMEKDSVVFPRTLVYGNVEFRPATSDTEAEASSIKASCASFGFQPDDFMVTARVATIVDSPDRLEAIEIATGRVAEVLDIKSTEFSVSNYEAAAAGFVKDLGSGEITPLLREGYRPSLAFVRDPNNLQVFDVNHYILSLDTELSQRYRRSLHWSRNARHEPNAQLKILFLWFALEALVKEGEWDNIEGLVRWFLGFPNGRHLQLLSKSLFVELRGHKVYDFWERELKTVVDRIREFRNDSVHSGFRSLDFTSKELALYSQVAIYAASRGQRAVVEGLLNNLVSVGEFKEFIAPLFESVVSVNDVHNNILFSLENARQGRV